ncbi:MAG: Y-family DNA polymerase [Kiritimatiellae bacterium]|nr:Y-family DNA polymerase [Kiritimatiellia bacterium]
MIGLVDGNNFFVSCERVFNRRLVGRPVAVLSNNDGCCVSRSNEFKALGIPMGTPYFQLKHREASGELCFCSSNYELYGDMSRRIISILREEAVDVEQYSIDEAFIHPPTTAAADYIAYGKRVRAKILRWVGIPCGVGFAPTKTLAKIANHIGKKRPDGVFLMPDDPTEILAALPVQEVWGVGRRLPLKLRAERILTAQHLRDAPDTTIRSIGGVTLLRTAMELRGIPCHEERDYDADPDSISCSRSFGEPATTAEALAESLAAYTAQAAAKLRRHGLLAAGCNIYAQVFASGGGISPELSGIPDKLGYQEIRIIRKSSSG